MNEFEKAQQEHCTTECRYRQSASDCPLRKIKPNWCPKCNGVIYEHDDKGRPLKVRGGMIPVYTKDGHTLWFACDCQAGDVMAKNVRRFEFNYDLCFGERTHYELKQKEEKLKDRPSYSGGILQAKVEAWKNKFSGKKETP